MQNLINLAISNLASDVNNCLVFTNLDFYALEDCLMDEGYTKDSKVSDIQEGIIDLFCSVGYEEFGVTEK